MSSFDDETGIASIYTQDPNLPKWTFKGIPGWLAFTTHPMDQRQHPWTPSHPNRTVAAVILEADEWSEWIEEGRDFRVLVPTGNLSAILSEVSRIPYGCDGQSTMAAFRIPEDLDEEVVWIVPKLLTETQSLAIEEQGAPSAERRVFTLRDTRIELTRTSESQGHLILRRGQDKIYSQSFEKHYMEGAERSPLDLSSDVEIGVPIPRGAWLADRNTPFMVFSIQSYETVTFEALLLSNPPYFMGKVSYVLCAY